MNISVVIPNYNGRHLLEKNLPRIEDALANFDKDIKEIIVVDDASSDESVSFITNLKLKIENLKLIENEKNLGFSSTVNKGVKEAKGDIIILLNTDVSPENNFLIPLIKHFEDQDVFAVGCLDKSVEGKSIILRGRGLGRWQRGFLVHRRGEVDKTDTLWVSGGSGAFRKIIWDKLGGLNELYNPFYYEDIDLSYRAVKSGFKVLFEPQSVVVHEHDKGSIKSKFTEEQIKRVVYRNQFLFVWVNVTDLSLIIKHILWLPYHFLKAISALDIEFILGFLQAFILLPKVIKSKIRNKKNFIKKDYEIINLAD